MLPDNCTTNVYIEAMTLPEILPEGGLTVGYQDPDRSNRVAAKGSPERLTTVGYGDTSCDTLTARLAPMFHALVDIIHLMRSAAGRRGDARTPKRGDARASRSGLYGELYIMIRERTGCRKAGYIDDASGRACPLNPPPRPRACSSLSSTYLS